MYTITDLGHGRWLCEVRIQDGTERWEEKSRREAIHSVIKGARSLNHSYIREDDITFLTASVPANEPISEDSRELLAKIKTGHLKVLPFDHFVFKYRITEEEAELLVAIREGDVETRRLS